MKSETVGVGGGCKYHPSNKEAPGVCPSCLRDKLLKLYDNNNSTYPLPCPPPPLQPFPSFVSGRHRRHSSLVMDSASSMVSFDYGLKKSNSLAFTRGIQNIDREGNGTNRSIKKSGVWSKILKLTKNNTKEIFMHSRTSRKGKSWHFQLICLMTPPLLSLHKRATSHFLKEESNEIMNNGTNICHAVQ
ncbi:hypothetical protein VNO78_10769 [Psophocarpus tetragonolobus]|uniref:Uncharacterized protein n=1 Tax=Psophocarpus tetragonolobus TaxID=3891 RepID=A0AAN9SKA5_PSOTE